MGVARNASLQSTPTGATAAAAAFADADASPHVVVVEDDPALRALLSRILRECGYDVTGAADGVDLQHAMAARPIDLILLDIMLPGPSGLELCQSIRERSRVPIIMVSARGEERDRVTGLDNGADDYIAKPFGRAELLARVRATLRRAGDTHVPLDIPVPDRFDFADWHYHARRRELISPRGAEVELTGAEHELLVTFLRNPQRTIGRERLLEMSRSRIGHASDRSIDVMVSRLRAKFGDGRRAQPIIRTIRGVGYMFAPDVTSS